MSKYQFTVIYEKQTDGSYVVSVPALAGCHTEGRTLEEAQRMAVDAIQGYLVSLIKHGEPIPEDTFKNQLIGSVEVPVETAA